MNVLTSLEILILVALIGAFLELSPGIFMLFYHYALGKHSKKTADDLSLFYLAGVESFIILVFLAVYYAVFLVCLNIPNFTTGPFAWIMSVILLALAIFSLFFYFKKGPSMSLFIPRKLAKAYEYHTRDIKTRRKAFFLGFISLIPELFMTLPLYIISTIEIMKWNELHFPRPLLILLGLIIILSNLLLTRLLFRSDHNLAEIDRLRRKNKTFIRIILAILYTVLAILIICQEF